MAPSYDTNIINNKRNSLISIFNNNKKDDKEKEEKEKNESLLSGMFSRDKDNNKRKSTSESEKHTQHTQHTRTTSHSDALKNKYRRSYVFSDDDDDIIDTTPKKLRKSRRTSSADGLEKVKSTKKEKRLSVGFGKFFGAKSTSQKTKNDEWGDNFLEPDETTVNPINIKNKPFLTNEYVEPPQSLLRFDNSIICARNDGINSPKSQEVTDESQNDDTNSSTTGPSSFDDQDFNSFDNKIINNDNHDYQIDQGTSDDVKDNNVVIVRGMLNVVEVNDDDNNDNNNDKVSDKLKELEDTNNSLKAQIDKFNSMEQIMQQQFDLSKRMTETINRLESKVEAVARLEDKIDQQNQEINVLKSIVDQLRQRPQLLITSGDTSPLEITQGEDLTAQHKEERALVPTNHSQSPQIYSKSTLVNTLVVNPLYNTITASASIATSVLYAVYVRPVVGLVKVVRDGI